MQDIILSLYEKLRDTCELGTDDVHVKAESLSERLAGKESTTKTEIYVTMLEVMDETGEIAFRQGFRCAVRLMQQALGG